MPASFAPLPAPPVPAEAEAGTSAVLLRLTGVSKSYGPTFANRDLSFDIATGDVIGLVGANGAGKSTLMRVIAGVTRPDAGSLELAGEPLNIAQFSALEARRQGIRIVYQELSLCDSLTVAENFYLEAPHLAPAHPFWRARYERLAREMIGEIFPDAGIDPRARIGSLPIAQRQMVEIARAASDPGLRLLILDEPTSSLDSRRSAELRAYISARAANGISFVFISHKLTEVAAVATRVLVMQGGRLVWQGEPQTLPIARMVALMAGEEEAGAATSAAAPQAPRVHARRMTGPAVIEADAGSRFSPEPLAFRRGEIIGVAGLEGNGQRPFIRALHEAARRGRRIGGVRCLADAAFIPGDRAAEGVFALWTVLANATIGQFARAGPLRPVRGSEEIAAARPWLARVQLDLARIASPILDLSGGNQQKVLLARALLTDAEILVLDDPTRGVDAGVKQEFYRLIREAAAGGKLVVWYSTEDSEFLECDRVLVFHDGAVLRELAGAELTRDALLGAAFAGKLEAGASHSASAVRSSGRWQERLYLLPPVTTALMFLAVAALNADAASLFGIDLLTSAAVPLVLVSLGQMFVIGGSEIDLGAGAFAGLVNVLSATILVARPSLGALALAGALAAMCALGLLIRLRGIPAIIVTLGASFIWLGIGYTLQPVPGGSSPKWLSTIANFAPIGIPSPVVVIVLAAVLAHLVNASRSGVMLRGFGANADALERAGWSPLSAYARRYLLAGGFGLAAGLMMTAINTASDINAGNSYTLLSIAAAVIGGSALIGGAIAPIGVVCGALTLSLIGSLLGFLGVSTNYNAAVQGGLLIATLLVRALERHEAA
ncbi:MAG: ATP-binding cassette domain-containing protein [Acetobacteraceae bacterium]